MRCATASSGSASKCPLHPLLENDFTAVDLLAEAAELADEIDVDRAQQAYERAKARLEEQRPETDIMRAQFAMRRALGRISTASR